MCCFLYGPGVRDYIHVVDLAKGHVAAIKKLEQNCGCKVKKTCSDSICMCVMWLHLHTLIV